MMECNALRVEVWVYEAQESDWALSVPPGFTFCLLPATATPSTPAPPSTAAPSPHRASPARTQETARRTTSLCKTQCLHLPFPVAPTVQPLRRVLAVLIIWPWTSSQALQAPTASHPRHPSLLTRRWTMFKWTRRRPRPCKTPCRSGQTCGSPRSPPRAPSCDAGPGGSVSRAGPSPCLSSVLSPGLLPATLAFEAFCIRDPEPFPGRRGCD